MDEIEKVDQLFQRFTKKVIKRIPGEIPPMPKTSSQGYLDDLSKKQKFELIDLLERQKKLLANKKFISKLPDKGEKISNLKQKLELEIKNREEIENAAQLLSRLNIASEGKEAMSKLEWTGKYNPDKSTEKIVELDSDDDEEDPLKILAQPTGTGVHKKKVIHLPPEESCIKPEDLEDSEDIDPIELGHVNYIVDKVENIEYVIKDRSFKPYKTTKSNVHDFEKEKKRCSEMLSRKKREITAVIFPPIKQNPLQILDIKESLRLQQEHTAKMQEIQTRRNLERLTEKIQESSHSKMENFNYREKIDESCSSEDDDKYDEVHDDDDEDLGGTVTYSVDKVEL